MNRPPDTCNSDCDRFIRETFVRLPHKNAFDEEEPVLLIKPHTYEMKLTYQQASELIRYLRERFCPGCGGTGFDPDTLNGRCEYCGELPF